MTILNGEKNSRAYFTLSVMLCVSLLLAREFFTGGVVTHHLLAQADMPGISNWWGLLIVPLLAWCFFPYILNSEKGALLFGFTLVTLLRLAAAIVYGAAIAASWELGYDAVTQNLFLFLFLIGMFYPVYRGEFVVGFVLGMAYTFGGILPVAAAGVVASVSLLLHPLMRLLLKRVRSG